MSSSSSSEQRKKIIQASDSLLTAGIVEPAKGGLPQDTRKNAEKPNSEK